MGQMERYPGQYTLRSFKKLFLNRNLKKRMPKILWKKLQINVESWI